ncbi:hypothetical protein FB451DRAFT_1476206 [Mycena latifolia]|nr:hypothetical protein FB451DRAFT_1476206 [Mycena latifolia]
MSCRKRKEEDYIVPRETEEEQRAVETGVPLRRPEVIWESTDDDPLRQWAEDHQDSFLAELLRGEGRGDHRAHTTCRDYCLGGESCIVSIAWCNWHRQLPFHRIQTLKKLGLRIQLGHWGRDRICPKPQHAPGDDFVIVDVSGVHEVGLDYCGCGSGVSQPIQLLYPRSASSFNALRRFHLLSFESKCSAYEFYYSLARETDNTGLKPVKDRYHEFLRMARQWRHLEMLKRGARGHDPEGIANTQDGELALLCPAFLFALFLAMDANFRLRRKEVSSEEKDPGLGKGWSFFCEVKAYMKHVKANWKQVQERSHCVAHDAVDKPDREAWGTASSGIGAVDCACHNMKRPNAVAICSLGKGMEQEYAEYLNMDYMFFKSVKGTDLVRFFVSYDIACQWHINIWVRMIGYKNEDLMIRGGRKYMTFLVPKFHLPAHIEACNLRFSFNLTRYRGWADTNPLARSTAEMGPGSRRDTLNDHFNDWNYKKILLLGKTMRERTLDAVPMMMETRETLADLEKSFEGETLVAWREMLEAWEADAEKPNPFGSHKKDEHLAQVRRELAEEAAAREAAGIETLGAVHEEMHVTELVAMGLQLEDQQRVLRFDVSATGLHPTDKERTAMVERTSKLRRKIFAWMDIQKLFFPVVETLRKREDEERARIAALQAVPGVKYRLRVGQANEALHDVRRHLLVRTHLYQVKDRFSRGVKRNTRSKTKIDVVEERIRRAAAQYRAAWAALKWEATLKELTPDDVRGMPERPLSWIWLAQRQARKPGDPEQEDEALRIEWAKTNARAMRWSEEVDLLEEEMCRVLQFLTWQADWWEAQVGRRELPDGPQLEGETAYALRQGRLKRKLGAKFTEMWTLNTATYP